jgi:hypothetical protein
MSGTMAVGVIDGLWMERDGESVAAFALKLMVGALLTVDGIRLWYF